MTLQNGPVLLLSARANAGPFDRETGRSSTGTTCSSVDVDVMPECQELSRAAAIPFWSSPMVQGRTQTVGYPFYHTIIGSCV